MKERSHSNVTIMMLALNRYIRTVHEEKKPVKCNVCDKAFSLKANLRVHIGSVHKGKT